MSEVSEALKEMRTIRGSVVAMFDGYQEISKALQNYDDGLINVKEMVKDINDIIIKKCAIVVDNCKQ